MILTSGSWESWWDEQSDPHWIWSMNSLMYPHIHIEDTCLIMSCLYTSFISCGAPFVSCSMFPTRGSKLDHGTDPDGKRDDDGMSLWQQLICFECGFHPWETGVLDFETLSTDRTPQEGFRWVKSSWRERSWCSSFRICLRTSLAMTCRKMTVYFICRALDFLDRIRI